MSLRQLTIPSTGKPSYRFLGKDKKRMDLKQGDLENIILNALWDLEAMETDRIYVSDVQERIKSPQKKWAYTTVKTVLDRLVDKEIAERTKDGKKYIYSSTIKRDEAGIHAIKKVIRQYFKNDLNELVECLDRLRTNASFQDTGRMENGAHASNYALIANGGGRARVKELVHQH